MVGWWTTPPHHTLLRTVLLRGLHRYTYLDNTILPTYVEESSLRKNYSECDNLQMGGLKPYLPKFGGLVVSGILQRTETASLVLGLVQGQEQEQAQQLVLAWEALLRQQEHVWGQVETRE
jgi:hypothetical protein